MHMHYENTTALIYASRFIHVYTYVSKDYMHEIQNPLVKVLRSGRYELSSVIFLQSILTFY